MGRETGRKGKPSRAGAVRASACTAARVAGRVFLIIGGLAVLAGLGWRMMVWVHETPVFALKQVDISGHVTLDPGEIRALCNVEMGTHLFRLDVRRVGTDVEKCPRVRRAVVSRRLPDRLAVRIVERVPVAQVLADTWYEIDETGVVLGRVRPEFQHTLPKFLGVCGTKPPALGRPLEGDATERLLALLSALRHPPMGDLGFDQKMSLFLVSHDGSLMIPVNSGNATLLVGRTQWIRRIEKLAIVEPHWAAASPEPEMIDLRFEDQVVVGPMPRWGKELAQAFAGA